VLKIPPDRISERAQAHGGGDEIRNPEHLIVARRELQSTIPRAHRRGSLSFDANLARSESATTLDIVKFCRSAVFFSSLNSLCGK
jgi:hypothetical protein